MKANVKYYFYCKKLLKKKDQIEVHIMVGSVEILCGFILPCIFSSPEPKAPGELIV